MPQAIETVSVLGVPLSIAGLSSAVDAVMVASCNRQSGYVCAVNVHSTMEASRDAELLSALRASDLNVPDGVPIVWGMRALGAPGQQRVFGPTLMWEVCRRAEESAVPVSLYGSTDDTLAALQATLKASFPALRIALAISPPFRPLTDAEEEALIHELDACGSQIVFVGLGAPKQEKWMANHRGRVNAVMLGVGAAFDYHAGRIRRAPVWIQDLGLEWLFRLVQEPRRLWRRYVFNNPAYLVLLGTQIVRERFLRRAPGQRQSDADK